MANETGILSKEIRELSRKEEIGQEDLDVLREAALRHTDAHGRVTEALQDALFAAEGALRSMFDVSATRAFQTLVAQVGGKMMGPIHIPEVRKPYWLKDAGPLVGFRSPGDFPTQVDYVVIGAGLTGASVAKNLLPEVEKGKTVVVLEMGDQPASGASGRNGGNIEMMKESFLHDYRGFVEVQKDFLRARFPDLEQKVIDDQARRQSRYLLRFFWKNVEEILRSSGDATREADGIEADVSVAGWLRIAETKEEEEGLEAEVAFANETLGLRDDDAFKIWDPDRIEQETGIRARYKGRFVPRSGNMHPYKFVNGVLSRAIAKGVKLYTRTRVEKLTRGAALGPSGGTGCLVETSKGTILARKVIVATNAYTRDLFPELGRDISSDGRKRPVLEPRVSHISDFQHVQDHFKGRTMTRKRGDWYANFPGQDRYEDALGVRRGTLHVGGGYDTPIDADEIHTPPYIDLVFHEVLQDTVDTIPATMGQPPYRSWSGVMGFTVDRAPILSFFHETWDGAPDTSVVLAVAFNGYGGSQCANAGRIAAMMAIEGKTPEEIPDDIFSMRRFLTDEPLFAQSPE